MFKNVRSRHSIGIDENELFDRHQTQGENYYKVICIVLIVLQNPCIKQLAGLYTHKLQHWTEFLSSTVNITELRFSTKKISLINLNAVRLYSRINIKKKLSFFIRLIHREIQKSPPEMARDHFVETSFSFFSWKLSISCISRISTDYPGQVRTFFSGV
jgi:hypothetical protein